MQIRTACIIGLLALLLALPAAAGEKRADGFRLGAYLVGIDYTSMTMSQDDYDSTYTSPGIGVGFLGDNTHGGLVAGYLLAKHHEIGGILTAGARSFTTSQDDEDAKGSENGIRIGPYYDFNFAMSDVMNPFIGGHLGLFRIAGKQEDTTTTNTGWFIGPQGGLKVNIYKHISLDLTGWLDIGRGSGEYSNDEDYDWDTSFWNLGAYGGMSVYIF